MVTPLPHKNTSFSLFTTSHEGPKKENEFEITVPKTPPSHFSPLLWEEIMIAGERFFTLDRICYHYSYKVFKVQRRINIEIIVNFDRGEDSTTRKFPYSRGGRKNRFAL